MTLAELRALLQAAHERRAALGTEAEAIYAAAAADGDDGRPLTEDEGARLTALTDEARTIRDEQVPALEQRIGALEEAEAAERSAVAVRTRIESAAAETRTAQGVVRITREPGTYHRGGQHSYFKDLVMSRREMGDTNAEERMREHVKEVRATAGPELRVAMSRTDGVGGEFVPPTWLIDDYVALARSGRIAADLYRRFALPTGTDSVSLPKVATGATTAPQLDNGVVSNTDMTTSTVSGNVRTIAGQQVFALQLLEQSATNFDEVVFADLISSYAAQLDAQIISGTGTAPQLKGFFAAGVAGINITFTQASPTPANMYPKIADAIQQIHTSRFLPPQAMLMHPRRWAWFMAAVDTAGRPLAVANPQGPMNAMAAINDVRSEGAVGSMQGLPVYVDPNLPITTGGGTEDRIFVFRPDDLYLYEGDLRTRVLFETDANTLQVRLQVYAYVASIVDRYPASIAVVGGAAATTSTGMNAPTF